MIGKTISHYKIIEKLGEGGMGVVYKAEDIKLKRIVALKFLPHHLSVTNELNARLLNEAQMTAKLNHPHICTIYDIEEAVEEKYIVMEYVDGVTLRKKIKDSTLTVEESVSYAIQIGEALEEAHSQGIIHRDIKPDNIMINSKNQIKVMDFGIAKLKEGLGVTQTMSTSGTVSYMAPEQLSNSKIDGRVDIFSLGILLYEMLSSRLPFRGEHQAAMMYSIMNEEPEPINKYLSEVPSEMLHTLNRALEKDPEDRYQNVHDMVIDLKRLKKQSFKTTHLVPTAERDESYPDQKLRSIIGSFKWKKKNIIISALVVFLVCAVIVIILIPSSTEINPDWKLTPIHLPAKNVRLSSMSKDGNWIAFPAEDANGRFDVYMMNLSQGGRPIKVTSDSNYFIYNAVISPEANTILFSRINKVGDFYDIVSTSSAGGSERVLFENAIVADWRADGQRILFTRNYLLINNKNKRVNECWSVKPDGTDRKLEITDTINAVLPNWWAYHYSPDGNSIVWIKNFSVVCTELMITDLVKKSTRQLTFDKKHVDDAIWCPNGYIIFSSNRGGNINLWTISSSGGESYQVTRGSGYDISIGISNDGKKLLYSEQHINLGQIFIGNLIDGRYHQLTYDERVRNSPKLSPNGKEIAFIAQELIDISFIRNIFIMNNDGSNLRSLTDDKLDKHNLWWSTDGKWISYTAKSTDQPIDSLRVYVIQADNPGTPWMAGYGSVPVWFNEKEFSFIRSLATYKGSVETKEIVKFSEDSIRVVPMMNGKYVVIKDFHKSRMGYWMASMDSYMSSGIKNAKLIYKGGAEFLAFTVNEFYYVRLSSPDEIRKITIPGGKDVPVKINFPGLKYDFCIGNDGKTIVYANNYNTTKFGVISNLFK